MLLRGESWHRLRQEDFSQVDWQGSEQLLELVQAMMRTDPERRPTVKEVCAHGVVARARGEMEVLYERAKREGSSVFAASPLASVPEGFLGRILGSGWTMDLSG